MLQTGRAGLFRNADGCRPTRKIYKYVLGLVPVSLEQPWSKENHANDPVVLPQT